MQGEGGAHLRLLAPERAHERGVLGGEVGAVGHRLLVDGRAETLAQGRGLLPGVCGHELVAADDDGIPGREQAPRQALERAIRGPAAGVDPGRPARVEGGAIVEDVAGQRDEHRPRGRGERDLGGPAHDAGQIREARHLDRPLAQRRRHLHERPVEERLGEAVPLLLLAGRHQDRRAAPVRIEERAHRVAETRRDVDVARGEAARGAGKAVRHREHHALLEPQHVAQPRMLGQGIHDRELRGPRVSEEVGDALVLEQPEEGGTASDGVHVTVGTNSSNRRFGVRFLELHSLLFRVSAEPMRRC